MATKSFLEKVVLTNKNEIKKFYEIQNAESPRKDIQPVSDAELQKGKEFAKKIRYKNK